MKVKQNNKLIAKIMGVKPKDEKGWYDGYEIHKAGLPFSYGAEGNGTYELKFDTSWDWLMPVCKKCKIIINGMYERENPALFHLYELITRAIKTYDLEQTFRTLVEFIKLYNNLEEKIALIY